MKTFKVMININGEVHVCYRKAKTPAQAYRRAVEETIKTYGLNRNRVMSFWHEEQEA